MKNMKNACQYSRNQVKNLKTATPEYTKQLPPTGMAKEMFL
jgi:hypothetical protein